jgi:phosphonate transport system substrate-binding protein
VIFAPSPLLCFVRRRRLALGALLWAGLLPGRTLLAAEAPDARPEAPVSITMFRSAFTRVNENDAKAALAALALDLGRKVGTSVPSRVAVYETHQEMRSAITAGAVQVLIVGLWDFLHLDIADRVDILYIAHTAGRPAHRWQILARRDSGLDSLDALRGRRVLVLHTNVAHMGVPWMETTLLETQRGAPGRFFASFEPQNSPSAAVLPVFFGKAQACVVDAGAFELLGQLNPQLQRTLVPIAESPAMANSVICFSRTGWPSEQLRRDVARQLASLEKDPAGRQILLLFKCDRLSPFDPAQLDTTADLYRRYRQFQPQEGAR